MTATELIPGSETGKLNIKHLKRYWSKAMLKKEGRLLPDAFPEEWHTDITLLKALGLGLEQTMKYVYSEATSFDAFENWILMVTGGPDQDKIEQFNLLLAGKNVAGSNEPKLNSLLSPADHKFWNDKGYLIIRKAVEKSDCDAAIDAICDFLNIKRNDPSTWYNEHPGKQGIMVQLFQHPSLARNRNASKIRKAFEELWGRDDIWVNTDRAGFNPPETRLRPFQGPWLHWDVSIKHPVPFGTQGILYLADTSENQGAFTLVPGFQKKIKSWLESLPAGANPRQQNLYDLGPKPIAANAGDMIIWHQALPHGSSPNTSTLPRFVQYINCEPLDVLASREWI